MRNNNSDFLTQISSDPDSPIAQLRERAKPANDQEYLDLWFDYLDFRRADFSLDTLYSKYGINPIVLEFSMNVKKHLRETFQEILGEKLQNLEFTPRLELYLSEFPIDEIENTRFLVLAYLYKLAIDNSHYDEIRDLAKEFKIDRHFALTINDKHKLVSDKILEFKADSFEPELSLYVKDLVFNPVKYKVFASQAISNEEALTIRDTVLVDLFNISVEKVYEKNPQADEDYLDSPAEIDLDDIESIFNGEDQNKLSLEQPISIDENCQAEAELHAYSSNMDYLNAEYQWIKPMILAWEESKDRYTREKQEQAKKLAGLNYEKEKYFDIAKVRLSISIEKGFKPKMEYISEKLGLSIFETNILKILVLNQVFLGNFNDTFRSDRIAIGNLVSILLDNSIDQVESRKKFRKSSKLIRSGLVLIDTYGHLDENIWEWQLKIDNRLVEFVIGEEFDIGEYIDGGNLYKPKTKLENVILPESAKNSLIKLIQNYGLINEAKKKIGFDSTSESINSISLLFVGPSGSGKTMLANAIANHLDKKILLFNLNAISGGLADIKGDNIFSILFREARINDSIIFFDESELLLESRIPELLIELEKHDGVVIFATNANLKIDPAMRRRILEVIKFEEPGPSLRKKIWDIHLPENMILGKDVNLDLLSMKYEINGGFIKNAVFTALSNAVTEQSKSDPTVEMQHLEYGADKQLHNKLFMSNLQKNLSVNKGKDSLIVSQDVQEAIDEIINFKKASKVLDGEWDFKEKFFEHNGITVLFHGPSGTGKTLAAEVIAYETGKKLKIVNYAQVQSMWVGETEKALESLFKEVQDNDSILLFDEGDALFTNRVSINSASDRYANIETDVLLSLIEKSNVFAIITTNFLKNIDSAFYRRFPYIVEFTEPDAKMRLKLWKQLFPTKVPLAEDVDLEALANRYAFSGGDIKNVIVRSATRAALRYDDMKIVFMDDLIKNCKSIQNNKGNGMGKVGY